jgi:hypothetical protein
MPKLKGGGDPQDDLRKPTEAEDAIARMQQRPASDVPGHGSPVDSNPHPGGARGVSGDDDYVSLEDIEEHLNVCYYGREGTTKTTAVASMAMLPQPGRVLVINAEGGLKRTALARRGIDTSRIVMWPKPGDRPTFEALEALYWRLNADLRDDPRSWLGVGIDSGTEVSTVVLEDATVRGIALGQSQGKARYDRFVVDRDDYRVMTDQMRSLIRKFRDLPCHFAITALEREDEVTLPSGDKVQMWGPAFSPKLAQDVLGYVDLVVRTQADRIEGPDGPYSEILGFTRATRAYRGKDRFDATPDPLAVPSFDRLVHYVRGEYDSTPDLLQDAMLNRRAEAEAHRIKLAAEKEEAKAAARAARRPAARKAATPTDDKEKTG